MECNSLVEVVRSCKWRRASLESMAERRDYSETSQIDQSESKEEVKQLTPTYSQGLINKWYSISLSVSFGVFRARRRMRRVLSI